MYSEKNTTIIIYIINTFFSKNVKILFRLRVTSVNRHPTHNIAILKFSQRIAWTSKVAPICWGSTSSTLPPSSKVLLASWAPTTFGSPAIPHWADLPLRTCSDGSSPCVGVGSNLEQATLVSRPWFTHSFYHWPSRWKVLLHQFCEQSITL